MTLVEELEPDGYVVALATTVALAASVDPALLREARVVLHPGSDPGVEADLWFSPLVEVAGPSGFVLAADVLDELRTRLAEDQPLLERAWQVTKRVHTNLAPILRVEEEVTYQGLRKPRDTERIDTLLHSVLDAMSADAERAPRLARWLTRAAPRWPAAVRELESAWKVVLRGSLHAGGLRSLVAGELPADAQRWLEDVLPADPPRRWLGVRLWDEHVELGGTLTEDSLPVHVPDTEPAIVTVKPHGGVAVQVAVRSDSTAHVPLRPVAEPSSVRRCFISYTGEEGESAALRIGDALEKGTPPVPVWLAVRDLRPDEPWERAIQTAIDDCRALLFVATRQSIRNRALAEDELMRAVQRGTPVIALLFDADAVVPDGVRLLAVVDFTGPFERGLADLRRRLTSLGDDRDPRAGDEHPLDATVELRTAGGDLHRLHREWRLPERIRAYADVLHVISLGFHVGALAPEGERAEPDQFGLGVLRDPKAFEGVRRSAEWAMSSVRDAPEGVYALDWVEPMVDGEVVDRSAVNDVAGAAEAYLAALGEFLRYRLEHGDFDWESGVGIASATQRFLELNLPRLEVTAVERPQAFGDPQLTLRGRYSTFVELFELCAERLVGALQLQEQASDADHVAARDDTLRRLLRFWPAKIVGQHLEGELGSTGRGSEPRYIPRDADAALDRALASGARLVIVAGPAMSGYKRTALEGMRRSFEGSRVLVPADARALARLSADAVVPGAQGTIVWLAQLERFVGNGGLTPSTLDGLLSRTGAMVALATIELGELASRQPEITRLDAAIIEMQSELSEGERARVAEALPDAYEVIVNEGLVRYFSGETTDPDAVRRRIRQALANPQFRWRTVERLAREVGITESEAVELLRADDAVRFGRNREGKVLVGLRWRVDEAPGEEPSPA
jgi:hypothetical protein